MGHLGVEKDVVLTPLMHDSPAELAQPDSSVKDWKKGECEADPRQDHARRSPWSSATIPTSTSASRPSAR